MFMRNMDKGLTMDQMVIVNGPAVLEEGTGRQRLMSAKDEMKKIPGVLNVATSGATPGAGYNWGGQFRKVGAPAEDNKSGSVVWIDPDFIDTYNVEILAGKKFDITLKSSMNGVIVIWTVIGFQKGKRFTVIHHACFRTQSTIDTCPLYDGQMFIRVETKLVGKILQGSFYTPEYSIGICGVVGMVVNPDHNMIPIAFQHPIISREDSVLAAN